ncbi:sex peptide receptor-related protein 2-like [Mytilus californianus]|uniref:sex peptide receptor-related protein 2-like n=1 Tax=Mytilus californianus TaxID=6549 RepID=UPI0022463011|nr:sex peptide receptor-related protein 2-like [Mytilus californianus]
MVRLPKTTTVSQLTESLLGEFLNVSTTTSLTEYYLDVSTATLEQLNRTKAFSLKTYFESGAYIYYGYVGPIITFFVTIMNIMLIATIIKGNFRTSTHAVMVAIAIADILTGIIPVPFNIQVFSVKRSKDYLKIEWCYIFEICQVILPTVFHLISLSLTVGLSIERFFVVSFPLKAKRFCTMRNGILFSICVFVISLCAQIDTFEDITYDPVKITSTNGIKLTGCRRSVKDRSDREYITRMFILRFIPCMLLVIFTILLLRKSSDIQEWRKSTTSSSSATSSLERMDFAVSLIATIVFLTEITMGTLLLNDHLNSRRKITSNHALLSGITYVVYMVTSPINFAILCFLSKKFRQTFLCMFCRH